MKDVRIEKLARVLVDYSTKVEKGDKIVIRGTYHAEPLMLALFERCLEKGAHPMMRASIPRAEPIFYKKASDEQLGFVWETDEWMVKNADVSFYIISDANTRQLSKVDPERHLIAAKARKHLQDIVFERSASGEYRWNIAVLPTEALAMEAEMSLDDYEDFYYRACLLDNDDPIAEWQKMADHHARMIEWMKGRSEVHLEGEGTDLHLNIAGRTFVGADGTANMPDGEIFTGPVEDRTNGVVTFSFPAIRSGQVVEGVKLTFEDGRVVDATARRNEEYLIKSIDTDEGARVIGELGIGTNYGVTDFTGEVLLDEKIGGTIHLALGAAYPETGGVNQSAIHWDMVCDLRKGGRISVDGDVLMEDGELKV